MAKQAYTSDRRRLKNGGLLGRPEHPAEDDRPFAEIRKSLHNALHMLCLHRWAFFVPFSLITCGAFVFSLHYPRTYRATTSFERRNDPVMMNLPLSTGAGSFKRFRSTMVRDLTSVECLSEVVDKLGLTRDYERNEDGTLTHGSKRRRAALARALAGNITVTTESPSEDIDIVRITYTGPDPTIGPPLVDEIKRTYIRRTMTWIHEFLISQRDYFVREAREAQAEVQRARREETRLQLENPNVDPTNPGAIALKLDQLEMERRELELRRREYEAEQSALQQLLAATEPQPVEENRLLNRGDTILVEDFLSPQAMQLAAELRELDRRIEKLKTTRGMTDLHPEVRDLLAKREALSERFEQQRVRDNLAAVSNGPLDINVLEATIAVNAAMGRGQSERARLLVQLAAQKTKLKDVEISLEANALALEHLREAKRAVFRKQEEFAEVSAKVAQARHRYNQLQTTLANLEPAIKAVSQGRLLQFSEGQPARGSSIPVSPKSRTVILLSLLAGIVGGAIFVVLAEVLDNVYRSSGHVARSLALPMLESIDEIVTAQDRRRLFIRRVVLTPMIVICLAGVTGLTGAMAYVSIERPWAYEKIRRIPQTAIQLLAGEVGGKVG